ncbi:MAG: hypothetical protein WCN95_05235 [bacterium]
MSDTSFRKFFLIVLDDGQGISEEAFEQIKEEMTSRGCEDIVKATEVINGRAFINEDFAEAEMAKEL